MALTLNDAITQVRGTLNEATAAFWTDAEITYWIQEGVRDFCSKSLMYESSTDITLQVNQLIYTSADAASLATLIEPYSAIYTSDIVVAKGIIKVHPRKLGNLLDNSTVVPRYYCLHDRKIYMWPVSTSLHANATVTILGAYVTDDITNLEDEYQHLPIMYATAKCKQKDQKFAEAQALMSQYVMMANFERADKHSREEDTYDMFKVKGSGGEQRAG